MFKLDPIKFDITKFPSLSEKSFKVHHEGHHATYVNNLNLLSQKLNLTMNLEELIIHSYENKDNPEMLSVFNNAAQHFNHTFFWNSIDINQHAIDKKLALLIEKSFGSIQLFEDEFYKKGQTLFGSGWVWLVFDKNENILKILQTNNAINPMVISTNYLILSVIDVWEHAYYIDFMNKRVDYLSIIIKHLNWENANKELEKI